MSIKLKPRDMYSRITNKILIDNTTGCWNWTGARFKKPNGDYGQLRFRNKCKKAHRVSYEHFKGDIPAGFEVDHLCHNTLCVNPEHLECVTHAENMKRRKDSGLEHCKNGHKYTTQSTYIDPKRKIRHCRTCMKIRSIQFYERQKMAS